MNRIETVREVVDGFILDMNDIHERRNAYIHLYSVAQACGVMAMKRKENVELATIAGMLHDVSTYINMDTTEHAYKSAIIAKKQLEKLNCFSMDEINIICTAIYNHSDKSQVHGALDEILKDADVLQHIFYNPLFKIKEHEKNRYDNLINELKLME